MSRVLILILFSLWMLHSPETASLEARGPVGPLPGAVIFLGGYALLVAALALASRRIARRAGESNAVRGLERFHRLSLGIYIGIVVWTAVGIFGGLKWGLDIDAALGRLRYFPRPEFAWKLPGLILGLAPALAAWVGVWWAQYPAERALRERHLLVRLDAGLPVYAPPRLGQFIANNLRIQMLFIGAPLLAILLVRDVAAGVAALWPGPVNPNVETWVYLATVVMVFLFSPELLRRVAGTEPLPDGPLRRELEAMCKAAGLRHRDILLWRTNNSMSNALVMGLIPQVRYVMMSDLLLESMNDQEIEAVFAHELGHVVHRHLWWLIVVALSAGALLAGPMEVLEGFVQRHVATPWVLEATPIVSGVVTMVGALMMLGWLSQRLERQADVYAARTMEGKHLSRAPSDEAEAWREASYVGSYGASVFNSALMRLVEINCIDPSSRGWLHPSINKRIGYLQAMSADPGLTRRFDLFMKRTFLTMLATLVVLGVWRFSV